MAELTLSLNEATLRKLKAYAMLSGLTVNEIEGVLTGLIDQMLTDKCLRELGAYAAEPPVYKTAEVNEEPVRAVTPEPEEKEEATFFQDSVSGHELSSDEAEDEVKSLAEEMEPMEPEAEPRKRTIKVITKAPAKVNRLTPEEELLRSAFAQDDVADVGGDAEAFLDASLGAPKPQKSLGGYSNPSGARAARGAFNPNTSRVKVAEFTGEED